MAESVTKNIKRYKTPSKTFTEVSLTTLSTATLEKIPCFGQLLDHRESDPSGQGEFEI